VIVDIAGIFGDNLARLRRQADVSQDELATKASVHRTEISQLERGLRMARLDTLVKIAASLEVTADELLTGIGWEPGEIRRGQFAAEQDAGP
jgi:transcriptional regulator with XRE-family HTH domain